MTENITCYSVQLTTRQKENLEAVQKKADRLVDFAWMAIAIMWKSILRQPWSKPERYLVRPGTSRSDRVLSNVRISEKGPNT